MGDLIKPIAVWTGAVALVVGYCLLERVDAFGFDWTTTMLYAWLAGVLTVCAERMLLPSRRPKK